MISRRDKGEEFEEGVIEEEQCQHKKSKKE